jgi:hypothetical protein
VDVAVKELIALIDMTGEAHNGHFITRTGADVNW